ncbi:MAG: cupredoxin domain-containing protein [Actinobacteria bacterium]|nr:cupredoxin domain-containing protein [Actinomycetota bacterium]
MGKRGWFRAVAVVFALGFVLAACGGDDDGGGEETGGTTGTETGDGAGAAITIADFTFDPNTITVSGPTEVTITNNDDVAHTFTLDDDSVDQEIAGGESATVTVDVSASTGWVCRFHPTMTGTVEVA